MSNQNFTNVSNQKTKNVPLSLEERVNTESKCSVKEGDIDKLNVFQTNNLFHLLLLQLKKSKM